MVKITTENYKAEMLLNALMGLRNQKGLGYTNLLSLSRLSTALESVMKPYLEMKRDIIQKFSKKDEKTGQFVINPENQDEAMKTIEELAQANVELDLQLPLVLTVKDDSFLDFNIVNSFINVLGDENFKIAKLEVPSAQ